MPESVIASSNTSDGDVICTVDAMFPKSHFSSCFPALIIMGHFSLEIDSRMDICMQLVPWGVPIIPLGESGMWEWGEGKFE